MEVVFDGYDDTNNPVRACRWVVTCDRCMRKVGCEGPTALELTLFKLTRGPCSAPCDAEMMAVAREGAAQ